MAPANLDLSLDEVIQATKGDKGSGKGKGGFKRDAPKEEETVSLDMSLDELIEKDYLPPKGKGKGFSRDDDWVPKSAGKSWDSQGWDKTKAATAGANLSSWKSWKDESWDSWSQKAKAAPVAWKKAEDSWGTQDKWGASTKKDWSAGGKSWADDDWKPKPRGDDWSAKNSWSAPAKDAGSWDKWNWAPKPTPWDTPRQAAWRPTNEQEREERWNNGGARGNGAAAWDRREEGRSDRWRPAHESYAPPSRARQGYESHDVRDRRGAGRERSRTPPRRNYFDDVPRGNVITVTNIPSGLDSRDIRDAFQSATGPVTSCKMSDGTARISFQRPEDAKKAVATFDHGELNGKIIRVNITG